jgi:hypothetical protein
MLLCHGRFGRGVAARTLIHQQTCPPDGRSPYIDTADTAVAHGKTKRQISEILGSR